MCHSYNLDNQGWGNTAEPTTASYLSSTYLIQALYNTFEPDNYYLPKNNKVSLPTNYERPTRWIYAGSGQSKEYFQYVQWMSEEGREQALVPKGSKIIDLLQRGESRRGIFDRQWQERSDKAASNSSLGIKPSSYGGLNYARGFFLKRGELGWEYPEADLTERGATTAASFAGRVFYAGFGGDVTDGDSASPSLNNHVCYSQIVKNTEDINKCHSDGDPTSSENSDLLATDGGFIKIEDAHDIVKLVTLSNILLVFAKNGIWAIRGSTDTPFSALEQEVVKISEYSSTSPASIVEADGIILFWGPDAIYTVAPEQGGIAVKNVTRNTIQTLYNSIPTETKDTATGIYDKYEKRVRWVYNNDIREASPSETRELVLDLELGAFYTNTIKFQDEVNGLPKVLSMVEVPPFSVGTYEEEVAVGTEIVVVGPDPVVIEQTVREYQTRTIKYVTLSSYTDTAITFSSYSDTGWKDWGSVDAAAYLITGALTGGDNQRNKSTPYLTMHFRRTENSVDDSSEDLKHRSSCKVTSKWQWADREHSGRWGREFEAYRLQRWYISPDLSYEDGFPVVTTKSKLRGKGQALSIHMRTEPDRDCRILGWGLLLNVSGNV